MVSFPETYIDPKRELYKNMPPLKTAENVNACKTVRTRANYHPPKSRARGRRASLIQYLYGYEPSKGVFILELLIWNGVSILETFPRKR